MNETETRFRAWLDEFASEYLPLERRLWEAWWQASTRISDETEKELASAEDAYRRFLARPRHHQAIASVDPAKLSEPLLRRQHDLARRLTAQHRMDESIIEKLVPLLVEVEGEYARFRATFRGREVPDNEIKEVLRKSSDPEEAREAWEASKQIGPRVASRVLELVRLRNRQARDLGYENFQVMSLELSEIEPDHLFTILEELASATEAPYRTIREELDRELSARFSVARDELRPWHYGDPFFQSAPPAPDLELDRFFTGKDLEQLTRSYYEGVGMEVGDVLGRSDLYEREGKSQHAFCVHIDRSGDVRVLCNVRPDEEWMGTMLHEFGHAVYDKYIDRELPPLLREPSHTLTTEAIAMLFGRLSRDRDFLVEVAGAEPDDAERVAARAREELRRGEIIFLRWALVVVHFERELYRDPEQDLDGLWWKLVKRYQLLTPPEGRRAPDWAAKIHIATAPVYYQNYILGELTASQLQRHLRDEVIGGATSLVGRPEIGAFLEERFFAPGRLLPWRELIRRATGKELSAADFLEEFG